MIQKLLNINHYFTQNSYLLNQQQKKIYRIVTKKLGRKKKMKRSGHVKNCIWLCYLVILVTNEHFCQGEIIKFKGDWMMQDHYDMKTGEKL